MMIGDYIVHIVDDEEAVRKSLAFLLTMHGFTVRVHDSATDFLAAASTIRNGCLVTDLRMPDMSGVELLRGLQAAKAMIPSIVITGHGDVPMAVEAMKAGALDFIEKPFEDEVLIEAIKRAAERLEELPIETDDVAAINRGWNSSASASGKFLRAWWPACRTRPSRMTLTSARARSRSIGPMS